MIAVINRKEESQEGLANQTVENVKLVSFQPPTRKCPFEIEGFQAINHDTKSVQSFNSCTKYLLYFLSYCWKNWEFFFYEDWVIEDYFDLNLAVTRY
jgi:hypothetical protein